MDLAVEAIIEIPKGTRNKYEYDRDAGVFRLARVLYSPLHYPADYGFVRETSAADGNPLAILVMISTATFPGCLVPARTIGALTMEDDRGTDTILLAVAAVDPRFDRVQELRHLSPQSIREMEYFFGIYKDLEDRKTAVTNWHDRNYAASALAAARKTWEEKKAGGIPRTPKDGKSRPAPIGKRTCRPAEEGFSVAGPKDHGHKAHGPGESY